MDCLWIGYYVAAGIPIRIDILGQRETAGWSARIGCHSDDLKVGSPPIAFLSVTR